MSAGDAIAQAILDVARKHNATQIVIGHSSPNSSAPRGDDIHVVADRKERPH